MHDRKFDISVDRMSNPTQAQKQAADHITERAKAIKQLMSEIEEIADEAGVGVNASFGYHSFDYESRLPHNSEGKLEIPAEFNGDLEAYMESLDRSTNYDGEPLDGWISSSDRC